MAYANLVLPSRLSEHSGTEHLISATDSKRYKLVGMRPSIKVTMPTSEMIEGPEAWNRFENVMKRALSVPHSEIKKRIEAHRAAAAKNPNRPGPKPKRKARATR